MQPRETLARSLRLVEVLMVKNSGMPWAPVPAGLPAGTGLGAGPFPHAEASGPHATCTGHATGSLSEERC